jgi:trk system potassium uptake protein TrkA
MFVIIIGGGRIGYQLARILGEEDCEVTVIDKKSDVCNEIMLELGCAAILGDATKPAILEEAGIHDADMLVALTGSDETNLIVSLVAKQLGAKQVAARLGGLHYDEATLKKIGLDVVIYPEAAAANYIAELVTKPELLDLAFIARGDAEIIEVEVKKGSEIVGRKIKDIENPQGTAIIAVFEKGKIKIPDQNTKIESGDKILVLAKVEKIKELRKILQ